MPAKRRTRIRRKRKYVGNTRATKSRRYKSRKSKSRKSKSRKSKSRRSKSRSLAVANLIGGSVIDTAANYSQKSIAGILGHLKKAADQAETAGKRTLEIGHDTFNKGSSLVARNRLV